MHIVWEALSCCTNETKNFPFFTTDKLNPSRRPLAKFSFLQRWNVTDFVQ